MVWDCDALACGEGERRSVAERTRFAPGSVASRLAEPAARARPFEPRAHTHPEPRVARRWLWLDVRLENRFAIVRTHSAPGSSRRTEAPECGEIALERTRAVRT